MFYTRQIAALAMAASCLAASAAFAATPVWPTSIVGTWKGYSNQTAIVLKVTTVTPGGKCQNIAGTITNVGGEPTTLNGYYCPGSGAVEFLRLPTGGDVATQVYSGSLNQINAGAPQPMMAGTFGEYSLSEGPLGQYSFSVFQ